MQLFFPYHLHFGGMFFPKALVSTVKSHLLLKLSIKIWISSLNCGRVLFPIMRSTLLGNYFFSKDETGCSVRMDTQTRNNNFSFGGFPGRMSHFSYDKYRFQIRYAIYTPTIALQRLPSDFL